MTQAVRLSMVVLYASRMSSSRLNDLFGLIPASILASWQNIYLLNGNADTDLCTAYDSVVRVAVALNHPPNDLSGADGTAPSILALNELEEFIGRSHSMAVEKIPSGGFRKCNDMSFTCYEREPS